MADITEVVTVNITVQDSVPAADSFGILALFGYTTAWSGWKTFKNNASGLSALVTAGVPIDHPLYMMLTEASSQNPKIDTVKIWARTTRANQAIKITPTVLTLGKVTSFVLTDGIETFTVSYTNGGSETQNTIATALATASTAASVGNVTGTHTASNIFFTLGLSAGTARYHISSTDPSLIIEDTSTDGGIVTDLNAALAADKGFYGVALETASAAEIAAAAVWAEANERLFVGFTQDTAPGTSATTDIAYVTKLAGYHHTYVQYSSNGPKYASVGLLARQLSRDPGSSSWAGKRIPGSTPDDISSTALAFIRGKNALTYVTIKGVDMTLDGKAASGRYLDVVIGIDWLKSIIQSAILTRIANSEKVDYTNEGISLFVSDVNQQLTRAQDAHLLARGWKTDAPDISEVTTGDKGTRTLNKITFSGVLSGGIQTVKIDGTVTL